MNVKKHLSMVSCRGAFAPSVDAVIIFYIAAAKIFLETARLTSPCSDKAVMP